MTKTKAAFKMRVPTVLKIIREAEAPIGHKELYSRLKAETGVKISETTFNKCLRYLLSTLEITKTEEKGPGGPVTYSLNTDYFFYKTDERIAFNAYWLKNFVNDYSPYGTEANLWIVLAREISTIAISLARALLEYSLRDDRHEAYNNYHKTIETEILPYMLKLSKLVEPPVKMSMATSHLLFKLYCEDVLDSIEIDLTEKPLHPFLRLTPEQEMEIDLLVSKKLAKRGISLTEEFPCNIDLTSIENCDYVKEKVNEREAQSEAFFETGAKTNRNFTHYREMMGKVISGINTRNKNPKFGKEFNKFMKKVDEYKEKYFELLD